jgi:hypothetical protein
MMQGKFIYYAGASGTVTLPPGATIKQIVAHSTAGGTITIFGGASIPVIAGTMISLRFVHNNCVSKETANNSADIVFTGTDSYYVETLGPGY